MCKFTYLRRMFSKMSSKQEQTRIEKYKFHLANKFRGKPFALEHFKNVEITNKSYARIFKRAEHESEHKKVPESVRIAIFMASKVTNLDSKNNVRLNCSGFDEASRSKILMN
jgi:hypothetical protein